MEKRRNCSKGAISPLFHNIFNICLTSRVQLHLHLLNAVVRFIFSWILQIWYVEVRISRSIFESPLEFEITRVDCIYNKNILLHLIKKKTIKKNNYKKNSVTADKIILKILPSHWLQNSESLVAMENEYPYKTTCIRYTQKLKICTGENMSNVSWALSDIPVNFIYSKRKMFLL